jgi:hypothetical protein
VLALVRKSVFNQDYGWFKGNLHTHSTQSDGILDPAEVARRYQEQGWNFLALTDHDFYSNWQELNGNEFLIIPGVELGCGLSRFGCHHIVGIHKDGQGAHHLKKSKEYPLKDTEGAQSIINDLTADNYLSIYCHPDWSRVEWDDIKDIHGFVAMEIYNHGCAIEDHTGLSLWHWDSFLRRGIKVWGVATDDAHHRLEDRCGGWICVNAPSLTIKDITDAIASGRFYSSSGPEIKDFGLDGDRVFVDCSPAKAIHFVAYEERGKSFFPAPGDTLSSASHQLGGREKYVRVEVVGEDGGVAWTNPIFLK